jgi:deoxyribonuclease-4
MLRFGTAGIPVSTPKHDILAGIEHVRNLGLDALEIEFVQSVNMKEEKARLVRKAAKKFDVSLSVHAPYYINLNSEDRDIIAASKERILKAARIGNICGAKTVVFHAGFYGKERERASQTIRENLEAVTDRLREERIRVRLGLETTGRVAQFGSVSELLGFCKMPGVAPVFDFSHIHARGNGLFRTEDDIEKILDQIERNSKKLLKNMHMHLSGIAYSEKGERHHLNLHESDFPWRDFVSALVKRKVSGTLISESPNIEKDALLLKTFYTRMRDSKNTIKPEERSLR